MADLIEALHALARQRGRGESPLVAVRSLAGRAGARISHLPISPALAQAWPGATGEPFHQHQSLALAALRRGEALALAGGRSARRSMYLLLIELLRAEAPATALLLAPDEPSAAAHAAELAHLIQALREPLRVGLAVGAGVRAAMGAQVIVATPTLLHERLLRHHARAWAPFWARLRLTLLAEAHAYNGPAAVHMSALLLRAQRLAPPERPCQLAATIAPLAGADTALAQIGGVAWRILSAEDTPCDQATLALWRAPGERTREALAVALGLARAGARVHLTCAPFEAPLLRALAGAEHATLSIGPSMLPAEVQVMISLGEAAAPFAQARDGARLSVLVLGDDPAEHALARLASHEQAQAPLLDGPPPYWVTAPGNAYIEAQHLLCAASERPISAAEAAAWGVEPLLDRLEQQGRLARLPGPDAAWQPLPGGGDPYPGFDPRAVGGAPALIADEQGQPLGTLDQATFDRWAFVGAALPPLRGGYRVVARDEDGLDLTVRSSPEARRTLPLRRCTVQVRDRRDHRELRGCEVAWGRVIVNEEVYGFREVAPGAAPAERVLSPPVTARWGAPALWIDLPIAVNSAGQLVGWSLAAALPLLSLSALADLAPAYDDEARRIYFVDAQPGGNGLAGWLFETLEELLPLAYDVALECRGDPLLEPLARADMDWLLTLLGGTVAAPPPHQAAPALPTRHEEPARRAAEPTPPPRQDEPPARRDEPTPRGKPPARNDQSRSKRPPARAQREQSPPAAPPTPPAPPPRQAAPPTPPAPAAPTPPATPPRQAAPPEPEAILPDAAAMVARLQRLRQQRERQEQHEAPPRTPDAPATPRFQPGDRIVCAPYGRGEVLESRLEDDHELLVVTFAAHGRLTIDAAVSAARLEARPAAAEEDVL